jgi:hypothetical protein
MACGAMCSALVAASSSRPWTTIRNRFSIPLLLAILYAHTGMAGGMRIGPAPNENPDGTLITESNCLTCRHFAYQGYVVGKYEPSSGCGRRLRGFPDTKLCVYYEREPGSDDE